MVLLLLLLRLPLVVVIFHPFSGIGRFRGLVSSTFHRIYRIRFRNAFIFRLHGRDLCGSGRGFKFTPAPYAMRALHREHSPICTKDSGATIMKFDHRMAVVNEK